MYNISQQAAVKVKEWITAGRGVAVWDRIDFSRRGDMITPARTVDGMDTSRPHWSVSMLPKVAYESLADFMVNVDKEVKRFHVGTRVGSQGFAVKVTDAGSRKIDTEVVKAGKGAYHVFDYGDYKNAVIMAPEKLYLWKNMKLLARVKASASHVGESLRGGP